MRERAFATAVLCLVLCSNAHAQTASDLELRAAYCMGAAAAQYEHTQGKEREWTGGVIIQRGNRMRDYLLARGFGKGRDPSFIVIAGKRGRSDAAECDSELAQPFYKNCQNRCDTAFPVPGAEVQLLACIAACPAPEACRRQKKCLEDFLPY